MNLDKMNKKILGFHVLSIIILLCLAPYAMSASGVGFQNLILPQGIPTQSSLDNPNVFNSGNKLNLGGVNSTPTNKPLNFQNGGQTPTNQAVPLQPNAFQLFILQSTGQNLPIYGQTLFQTSRTLTPPDTTPVNNNYVIGPGDELLIKIYSSVVDFDSDTVVSREGTITLPKIGPVVVAGKTYREVEPYLKNQLKQAISDFSLSVSMGNLHGIDIYIVGQARNPGKYTVSSVSNLLNAIFTTGGPSSNGSMRHVQLIRSGQVVSTIDLYDFIQNGKVDGDTHLLQGDVINFPKVGPEVALMGVVPTPAVYELSGNDSDQLKHIIQYAGGISTWTSPLKVSLERINAGQNKPLSAETLLLDSKGLSTQLKDGDILSFFPIKPAFDNAVTLNIPDSPPLRLPIKKGWRIKDLIPNREALLTSGYYLRRFNLLGETPGTSGLNTNRIGSVNSASNVDSSVNQNALISQANQSNSTVSSNLEVQARQGAQPNVNSKVGQPTNAFNNQLDQRNIADSSLQNYNVNLARIRASNQLQINWTQAIIERTRQSDQKQIILSFNLEKAIIDNDPQNNLILEPGDIVTILSQKDVQVPVKEQTRVVQLEGEVESPGIYQLRPGETLPQLIERAGGLTHSAYIYGTELDRASVKLLQQKNIETVIGQLEDSITRQATTVNATSSSSATLQQTVNSQAVPAIQAKINKLRSINPNGRVALNITPEAQSLPEVKLEDGDVIKIPQTPSSVLVIGAVYNDNALIFQDHKDAAYYVNIAGLSDSANKENIFIARANGIVLATHKSGWFGSSSVLDTPLMPGDTVVVPDKIYTEQGAFFRQLTDYTQLFSNLGITAATLKFLGII